MNQSQLYRSVAHVTGESVDVVSQIGFTVLTPLAPESDEAARWLQSSQRRASSNSRGQHSYPRNARIAS